MGGKCHGHRISVFCYVRFSFIVVWIFHDEFLKRQKSFRSDRCCSQTFPACKSHFTPLVMNFSVSSPSPFSINHGTFVVIDFHDFLILSSETFFSAFCLIWVNSRRSAANRTSFCVRPEIKNIFLNFETWEVIFTITWFFNKKLANFFFALNSSEHDRRKNAAISREKWC